MDHSQFDALTRLLSGIPSRRHLLRRLAVVGLGLGTLWIPGPGEAKKKRKRKKRKDRKPRPNSFGCFNVGDACTSAEECCSGICKRKTCRAHDAGGCQPKQTIEECGGSKDTRCTTNTGAEGFCTATTGKAAYCAASGLCTPCQRDADCEIYCGAGAACAVCPDCGDHETACVGVASEGCTLPPQQTGAHILLP